MTYQDEHIVIDNQQLIVNDQTYRLSQIKNYTLKPDLALTGCSGFFLIPISALFFGGGILGKVFGTSLILISIFFLLFSRRYILSITIDVEENYGEEASETQADILIGQLDYLRPIVQVLDCLGVSEKLAITKDK
ncbi:MAG: hypothetical protein VX830_13515 [Candidatus Poribacteria bacterium]|nr:hypothetical protein [Candidatus Poribacteria bacterium]